MKSQNLLMNETWHIPRPSLSGSSSGEHSSNSSSKSHSNPSTVNRNSRYFRQGGHTNYAYVSTYDIYSDHNNDYVSRYPRGSYDLPELHNQNPIYHTTQSAASATSSRRSKSNQGRSSPPSANAVGEKRGSRSSRGSTDSNSSTHSGASESLLLTAANLERFAAIHKKMPLREIDHHDINSQQNYASNFVGSPAPTSDRNHALGAVPKSHDHHHQQNHEQSSASQNADAIIAIDPNLHFVKTKDVDSVSIASSTHFTMVNGIGRPPRKTKSGICSRSHQITVLILTMSTIFLIGILFAVYLLEMRARGMPR
ncbi:unnamed protein product [Hermetia illucens]|uniref:Uncharacterized protein n=1 Tax=Hermetia illucens TaxID=343691 RepID=A0A7R8ULQ1_HERIL|nr:unnamed protein product [Hermetia illucens]